MSATDYAIHCITGAAATLGGDAVPEVPRQTRGVSIGHLLCWTGVAVTQNLGGVLRKGPTHLVPAGQLSVLAELVAVMGFFGAESLPRSLVVHNCIGHQALCLGSLGRDPT